MDLPTLFFYSVASGLWIHHKAPLTPKIVRTSTCDDPANCSPVAWLMRPLWGSGQREHRGLGSVLLPFVFWNSKGGEGGLLLFLGQGELTV